MGNFMEKVYINGKIINILKELISMELKKEKEKLNFLMEKNLFVNTRKVVYNVECIVIFVRQGSFGAVSKTGYNF